MNAYIMRAHASHTMLQLNSLTTKLEEKLDIVRIELFFSVNWRVHTCMCCPSARSYKIHSEKRFYSWESSLALPSLFHCSFAFSLLIRALGDRGFGAAIDIFMVLRHLRSIISHNFIKLFFELLCGRGGDDGDGGVYFLFHNSEYSLLFVFIR